MFRSLCVLFWLIAVLPGGAAVVQESFATDPATRGWRLFGDASLFRWNATNQNLEVTWDSSRTNSFFHLPLGTILSQSDDFSFSFDIRLLDIRTGSTPAKPYEFEIAIGLLNYTSATNTKSFRGSGVSPTYGVKNLIEFDYFPDAGFGETFATTAVSSNNQIFPAHNFPLAMTLGDTFRISLAYTARNRLLRTAAMRNGVPYGTPPDKTLADLTLNGLSDFRVDSFAVISYSDAIQTGPQAFHGSVLAHGTIDNVEFTGAQPVSNLRLTFASGTWRAEFSSRTNWSYTLLRTTDWSSWLPVSGAVAGNGSMLLLPDPNFMTEGAFYRIHAERP